MNVHEQMPDWFHAMPERDPEILEGIRQSILHSRREAVVQCDALLAAGWRYELPEIVNAREGEVRSSTEPWQWYWRSPPKRKRSKGKRFLSTNQAFMALQREKAKA